jgi:hypothetical protein
MQYRKYNKSKDKNKITKPERINNDEKNIIIKPLRMEYGI